MGGRYFVLPCRTLNFESLVRKVVLPGQKRQKYGVKNVTHLSDSILLNIVFLAKSYDFQFHSKVRILDNRRVT